MSGWKVDTGDPRTAECVSGGTWLLEDHGGGRLPGAVYHAAPERPGWIVFDDLTLESLRVRHVTRQGAAQILHGPGGEQWPIWPADPPFAAILAIAQEAAAQ